MRSLLLWTALTTIGGEEAPINHPPEGFHALFDGESLAGWKTDGDVTEHWSVENGILRYDGTGRKSLVTDRDYGDIEMLVDWKIEPKGDSGIYLRGKPQVQIWDNPIGSGGLFNNKRNPSEPLVVADNPVGEWNTFRIRMVGEKVTVHLNGKLVVDDVTLENWPTYLGSVPATGPIELQQHNSPLCFRNVFVKEL